MVLNMTMLRFDLKYMTMVQKRKKHASTDALSKGVPQDEEDALLRGDSPNGEDALRADSSQEFGKIFSKGVSWGRFRREMQSVEEFPLNSPSTDADE